MNKKILNLLLASILVCTAVYAKSYKITPKTNSASGSNYNVYTPTTYTPQNTQNDVGVGGIVEIVMDYSGSMSTTIDQAKDAVRRFYPNIPSGTKVGLRVFGQTGGFNPYTYVNSELQKIIKNTAGVYKILTKQQYDCVGDTTGRCSNTVQVLPVGLYNGSTFYQGMDKYPTGGATPLVYGLHLAITKDLAGFPATSKKKIILITDGGENCGGNPCEFVKQLTQTRSDIIIDVIIIGGDMSYKCLADTTGGKYYSFRDPDLYNGTFETVLLDSINTAPQVPNKETPQQTTPNSGNSGNNYEYIPEN